MCSPLKRRSKLVQTTKRNNQFKVAHNYRDAAADGQEKRWIFSEEEKTPEWLDAKLSESSPFNTHTSNQISRKSLLPLNSNDAKNEDALGRKGEFPIKLFQILPDFKKWRIKIPIRRFVWAKVNYERDQLAV